MTLKIERISGKRRTQIRLSGELRAEQLDQLKDEIERAGPRVALDLEEVHLVDIETVHFLNACVAHGCAVLHRSPYIKEWMFRERGPLKDATHQGVDSSGKVKIESLGASKNTFIPITSEDGRLDESTNLHKNWRFREPQSKTDERRMVGFGGNRR